MVRTKVADPMHDTQQAASAIRQLIAERSLTPHFQPIVALQQASITGYESLIRGPQGSPLHSPDAIFSAARAGGCELELEVHCYWLALRAFARSGVDGRLFVNMSAAALFALAGEGPDAVMRFMRSVGLLPSRLVIELTEHTRVASFDALREALKPMRSLGVGLALDDFGDGHSSLKSWTELAPDFVKVDKHFVQGIHASNRHLEILRVFLYVAERFGGALIAEGIEHESDLTVLRDMGVANGQGYLLGRPVERPAAVSEAVSRALRSPKIAILPEIKEARRGSVVAGSLMVDTHPVHPGMSCGELELLLESLDSIHAVPVVEDGRPLGIINKLTFLNSYGRLYHRELYGRRSCTRFMNAMPLMVEVDTPLESLYELIKGEDQSYLTDGFLITENGRYAGLATGERVVRALTEFRVEAARHANPLTSLPGNIPISEHIGRLLARRSTFVACYFDLSNFKPFNDVYGYWRGDEMIRLAAGTLVSCAGKHRDFVGHVGGDDFVVLFQSDDWEERCWRILGEFNERARSLYDEDARRVGQIFSEDRRGNPCAFPLTTLVIGAVAVQTDEFDGPEQVATAAAEAKRLAKQRGNGFHIMRRNTAAQAGADCAEALTA